MKSIKVSIIVPVYNVYPYLDKCLNSLVNQTLQEIEIIIVNDGSLDKSEEIILKYLTKYKNKIKYYKKENGGLSSARNYGLKYAQGEYVGFVDSDDYVDLTMYEDLVKIASSKKASIVVCATEEVYETKKKIINPTYNLTNDYKDFLLGAPMACNKLFKRELFEGDFLFNTNIYYEDLELIPSLILKTKNIIFINKPYYKYIQRSGSIMNQQKFNLKILDIITVLNNIEARFKKYKKYEFYKEEIEYLYIEHILYSAPLQIAKYKESQKYFETFQSLIKEKFPNWQKNKYLQRKSLAFKVITYLSYHKKRVLISMLNKLR